MAFSSNLNDAVKIEEKSEIHQTLTYFIVNPGITHGVIKIV